MALLHALVDAPGWSPWTFPGVGWQPTGGTGWDGLPVGVLTYTSINWTATVSGGGSLSVNVDLDRYNNFPLADNLTSTAPMGYSPGLINLNVLFELLSSGDPFNTGTTTATTTSLTYTGPGGSASISLSNPFTLQNLRDNAHFLFGQINIEAVPTTQWWDIYFNPGPGGPFGQGNSNDWTVPTLFNTPGGYYWGWGSASQNRIVPPQPIPSPLTHVASLPPLVSLNPTEIHVAFRNIVAQSNYSAGTWEMWKGIWRKPGQSSVGLQQVFTATLPGPPTQPTPTNITLPCDPNGDFILTPSLTAIDIIADTGNNNYMGSRGPNFAP
jgi:hypothetical protein